MFSHTTELDFKDISSEIVRIYIFPDGNNIIIDKPQKLAVTSYSHRVYDSEGYSYIIPLGFMGIKFKVKDNEPNFSF